MPGTQTCIEAVKPRINEENRIHKGEIHMSKQTKPADGKNDKNYQKNPGQKTPEVYESTLIDTVVF